MIKGKKSGKTLDKIGERWYGFNLKSEKNVYCYLCCNRNRVKEKALRDLDEELKFETINNGTSMFVINIRIIMETN